MSRHVRFNGRRHNGPTDTIDARPVVGIWSVGEVRLFDARLAHELGRACGPDCEGDCWAQFFVATQNINAERNAPWFEIVPDPTPDSPAPSRPARKRD